MRILALDHGSKRIGVAVSDETKTIAQPLEYIFTEPFADFLARLKKILVDVLKTAITVPIKLWDERLTSSQANKILIQGGVRRDKRKEKVDKMAAAILLQSYLDGI